MSDVVTLSASIAALMTPAGAGVTWFLHRIDRRVSAAEAKVEDCEQHRAADQALIAKLIFEVRRDHIAVRILFKALQRTDPRNSALGNVSDLLRRSYDPLVEAPDDLSSLLDHIDEAAA